VGAYISGERGVFVQMHLAWESLPPARRTTSRAQVCILSLGYAGVWDWKHHFGAQSMDFKKLHLYMYVICVVTERTLLNLVL
jgi:hypothetical protein